MYWFGESELAETIEKFRAQSSNYSVCWYRDVILQAQDRGYLKVVAHSDDVPFWYRKFDESIEISESLKSIIERNRQRDNKVGQENRH